MTMWFNKIRVRSGEKIRAGARLCLLLTLPAGLLPISPAAAQQERVRWGTGAWEINVYGGILNDVPEFDPAGFDLRRDAMVGGRFGYVFPFNLFVQAGAANSLLKLSVPGTRAQPNLNTFIFDGAVGYNLQPLSNLQLFGAVGGGAMVWDPDGVDTEAEFALKYAVGARLFATPRLAFRGEARMHHVPDALPQTRIDFGGAPESRDLWALELSAGLSFFLGGPRDSDGDGIYDRYDRCSDTPVGARVDDTGCPLDADADGVPDGIDRCPATPAGATVGTDGCPNDADGDRVLDGLDRCPDTPSGATVNADGCTLDTDADGVPDGIDRCADTPEGAEIDEHGCSVTEPPLVLPNVYFDLNRATLRADSKKALDRLGEALIRRPGLRLEIRGYADALGPRDFNQRLSRERARAALDYLLGRFPRLDPENFVVRGYGESDFVATNRTPEGRQENRRVEIRLLEGHEPVRERERR